MALGYDGKLYILAFDHRGSFQTKMFGIQGGPTPEQTETIADAKRLIFEGMLEAVAAAPSPARRGCSSTSSSAPTSPSAPEARGLKLAMPVEKSGQEEFDFEYGDDFAEHILKFDPDFSKVLVRYNPGGDPEMNEQQLERLLRLSNWLHENDRKFLFELLVPGHRRAAGRRRRRHRALRRRAASGAHAARDRGGPELPHRGRHLEGRGRRRARRRRDAGRAGPHRPGARGCRVRRARPWRIDQKVEQWLQVAAPVEGFVGFAIGRSIWWDALESYLDGGLDRSAAASQIADNYLRFINVYEQQGVTQ